MRGLAFSNDEKSAEELVINDVAGDIVLQLKEGGLDFRIVLPSTTDNEDERSGITTVKTLVWEAFYQEEAGRINNMFIVTALRHQDRIDEELLKREIESQQKATLLDLKFAELEAAERLTGFKSGTIPPFGHKIPMKLYIDQLLLEGDTVSIGAENGGYDIVMSLKDMMKFCEKTTSEVLPCRISDNNKRKPQSQMIPNLIDNTINSVSRSLEKAMDSKVSVQRPVDNVYGSAELLPHKGSSGWTRIMSKRLRDAAGKQGRAEEVRQLVQEAGESFPTLLQIGLQGNFTKNALHLAAWKGDLGSIQLLVDTGKTFGLDLVNVISTSEGNYGKTPIFYSITQCRDGAVSLLMSLGADLLIVNNKGQTPCSMAPSHLSPEVCQKMYEVEAEQLASGGTFVNYRLTNSDGKNYGDLDPRFPIDEQNMREDIISELEAFWSSVAQSDSATTWPGVEDVKRVMNEFPRVVRKTTREIREARRLARCSKGRKGLDGESYVHTERESRPELSSGYQKKKHVKKTDVAPIDFTKYEKLLPSDVLHGSFVNEPIIVDDESAIKILRAAVEESNRNIEAMHQQEVSDSAIARLSWGMDCEWKPFLETGQENPVSTLQLSTAGQRFLIDLQSLCRQHLKTSEIPMSATESFLSETLTELFMDTKAFIVGFGIGQDLSKLAVSFPHIPCFEKFESIVDLQLAARLAYPGTPRNSMSSLQKTVALIMQKSLDKSEQCSDWGQRPLTSSQIEYATLDAAVVRCLFEKMMDKFTEQSAYASPFFRKHPNMRSTVRVTLLGTVSSINDSSQTVKYRVKHGAVKEMMALRFAKQTFATGKKYPGLPEIIPLDTGAHSNVRGNQASRKKEKKRNGPPASTKKKGIMLSDISCDLDTPPPAGDFLGYTKESCVNRMLGRSVMNSLEEDFQIHYNRRGGIAETRNAWLLFVNFQMQGRYINVISEEGRKITFSVNRNKKDESSLIKDARLIKSGENEKKIFLFARPKSSNSKFIFCGECGCAATATAGQLVNLELELLNFEALATHSGTLTPFEAMIAMHK